MRIALIGQPNSGKSTLFNQVAGYRSETGNFSGTTVRYTETSLRVLGQVTDLVDLPGTYPLAGTNPVERQSVCYLVSRQVDVIVVVIDATSLSQGLELTLELMETGRAMIVAVNVLDQAARQGTVVDCQALQDQLGVPVFPVEADRGRGVRALFAAALEAGRHPVAPPRPTYGPDIEEAIQTICERLSESVQKLHPQTLAVKLLEADCELTERVAGISPQVIPVVESCRQMILGSRGQPAEWVLSGERHARAGIIADSSTARTQGSVSWGNRLDDVLLHPLSGYLILGIVLLLLFELVYVTGGALEKPLMRVFESLNVRLLITLGQEFLFARLLVGAIEGIAGGAAIVLPYLLPFLIGMGFLEDVGYLPRVAFLMDGLMHRLGLHGKAVIPFILGYGCSITALLSTRVLEERRDRLIAAALSTLIPCAARMAIVFGLVAFYLGPVIAMWIYIFNLFVIAATGSLLARFIKGSTPGMILELPPYRTPTLRNLGLKAWFRVRQFITEAWPTLIAGSIVLSVFSFLGFDQVFNDAVRPVTWALGLPVESGFPLLFGVMRKELSLIMLRQALNVTDFSAALNAVQMVTFTVFVVFYVPCLGTLNALRRELGWRAMGAIAGLSVVLAMLAALAARAISALLL